MAIEERLEEHGGCARRADVVRRRRDADELAALVREGRVVRAGRGVYALPGASRDLVVATLAGGPLTCVSAAAAWELPLLVRPQHVHVALPRDRPHPPEGRVPAGTVLHWDVEVDRRDARPVAPGIALRHATTCLPFAESVALVDAAVGRGLVRLADLGADRPRKGRFRFERMLRAADGRSGSLPESLMRVALLAAGLAVETQVGLHGVGRVDLLVEGLVVVEVDGFAFHSDRAAFAEDRRRDRAIQALGLPVLRFTYHDVVFDRPRVVQEVAALVRAVRGRAGAERRASDSLAVARAVRPSLARAR